MMRAVCALLLGITSMITGTMAQGPSILVRIEQDGRALKIVDNAITLRRASFDVIFEASPSFAMLVSASFEPATWFGAVTGKPSTELPGFSETGMAEGLLNADRDMIVADSAPSYWYYDAKKDHRFNKVKKKRGMLLCTHTVNSLWDRKVGRTLAWSDVTKPLYLAFLQNRPEVSPERVVPLMIYWAD